MAYILPNVKVFQEFGVSPLSTDVELSATIVGPNKKFLDYLRSDDKQEAFAGAYDNTLAQTVEYPSRDAGDVVDPSSIEIRFDDLKAELFSGTDGETDALKSNELEAGTAGFYFQDFVNNQGVSFPKNDALHNRGVKTGDFISVTDGGTVHESRVISFKNEEVVASAGTPTATALNHELVGFAGVYEEPVSLALATGAGTGDAQVGVRGIYQHPTEATTYTVTCTVSGVLGVAEFEVTDSGTDLATAQTILTQAGVTDYSLGFRGLTLVLDDVGATLSFDSTADVFTLVCSAPDDQEGVVEKAGQYDSSDDLLYTITCIDKGVSGAARINVRTTGAVDNSGPSIVRDGEEISIGSRGAKAVFTFPAEGVLIPGDSWTLQGRANGHGTVALDSGAGDETFVLEGAYTGDKDVRLYITSNTTDDYAAPLLTPLDFDWEMREITTDGAVAARERIVASGNFTSFGDNDDENTIFPLAFGIGVRMILGTGSTFTATHVETARLWSDYMELMSVGTTHDLLADAPELGALEVLGVDSNYTIAPLSATSGVTTGSLSLEGKYYHNKDSTYTVTADFGGGPLGAVTLDVAAVGDDVGHKIVTVLGVNKYYLGSHGLILNLTSDFAAGGAFTTTVAATDANTVPVTSAVISQGYDFANPIQYTLTCTTPGNLGVAEFSVASTNNIDDDTFITSAGVFEYAIGSRGIKVTFDLGDVTPATAFVLSNSWEINTAVNPKFTGQDDDTYTITITRGGTFGSAEVRVTSSLGDSSGPFSLAEDPRERFQGHSLLLPLGGNGLKFKMVDLQRDTVSPELSATFLEGDSWTVSATAKDTLGYNKLVLAKAMPTPLLGVAGLSYSIFLNLDDVLIPELDGIGAPNYEFDPTTVTINPAITVQSPDVFDLILGDPVAVDMPISSGASMYITYSALATAQTNQLDSIEDVDDIESKLGRIDPRNPLAFAVFKAHSNSNIPVKFLRLASDDATGYQTALDILEKDESAYAIVPLTQDPSIISAYRAHVDLLSDPDHNKWRVLIANQAIVTTDTLLDQRVDILGNLVDYTAILEDDPDSTDLNPPVFTRLVDSNATFLASGVTPGDVVLTDYIDGAPQSSYEIDSVVSDEILILLDGPNAPVTLAQKYTVVRPLNKDSQAQNHANIADSYSNHRVYLVWPDLVEVDGELVPGYHLCAAIAGMVAAFPPHQGFTNFGIAGFDSVDRTTNYFTESQLNVMAGAGVYIVTQNASDGQLFARHQLSTDNTSLELSELSFTKNLDSISFAMRAALLPYIGVWNVTEDAIESIKVSIQGVIVEKQNNTFPKIGPQLIDATINFVRQNEFFKDHIDADLDLLLPPPLNVINLKLRV